MSAYQGYKDLNVYKVAYALAIEIQKITSRFPADEKYSMVDQMRRSSRSVVANLAEAWKKRKYQKAFVSKLIDCAGEAGETEVWLDFARDFNYIDETGHAALMTKCEEINRMLSGMIAKADKFCN